MDLIKPKLLADKPHPEFSNLDFGKKKLREIKMISAQHSSNNGKNEVTIKNS